MQFATNSRNKRLLNTLHLQGLVSRPVLDEIADALEISEAGSETNVARKWQRSINRDVAMPGLYYADVPFTKDRQRVLKAHPFRLPSVKARELWLRDPGYFDMSASQGHAGRVETSTNWLEHPLFAQAGLHAVPMAVYGDGVPYVQNRYGKKGSLICIYFSFPHRTLLIGKEGKESKPENETNWMDKMHLFTVLRKEDLHKDAFDAIWDVLAWDMENMLRGTFADGRHDGNPLGSQDGYLKAVQSQHIAGEFRFAVVQLRQDWEHLCNVYGFKTWSAKEFCPFCEARKDPLSWFQFGTRAKWRSTVWSQSKLSRALQGQAFLEGGVLSTKMKFVSRLWQLPHFLLKYIKADPMHTLMVDGVVNKTMGWLL